MSVNALEHCRIPPGAKAWNTTLFFQKSLISIIWTFDQFIKKIAQQEGA